MAIIEYDNAVSTTPDEDGDELQVRRQLPTRFAFRVADTDGDFRMTYVERDEAVALARWILQGEA